MGLTGKQRAALLLASLDPMTAAELLKGVDTKIVQELAVELSYLDAAGHRNVKQTADIARQFCKSLQNESGFRFKSFLREMLRNTVGEDKARQIQQDIQDLLEKRDPFLTVRSASLETLAAVLETEHPQAAAVVLSELPPKKSSEVLGRLNEGVRVSAVSRMTNIGSVTPEARVRIAQMVRKRIEAAGAPGQAEAAIQIRPEQALRKVAVIVRNLDREIRDGVLEAIQQKDSQTGEKVASFMVIWEDITILDDRSLQEVLRCLSHQELALALHGAESDIADKIKKNISERAAAMVEEEASLMSSPQKEAIHQVREKILAILRERVKMDKLSFVGE